MKNTLKLTMRKFPTGGQLINEESLLKGIVPPHINLTLEEYNLIASSDCRYCGEPPSLSFNGRKYNGIERIKMSLPFDNSNTVPCCRGCAQTKMGRDEDRMFAFIKESIKYADNPEKLQDLINGFR